MINVGYKIIKWLKEMINASKCYDAYIVRKRKIRKKMIRFKKKMIIRKKKPRNVILKNDKTTMSKMIPGL
jgi:hypothetical protein